jgi:catechol 2,3-dioxygenase-like lactoylglutathione lyase family enzyme
MSLDHVGVAVTDFAASLAFFKAALAPLGIAPAMTIENAVAAFGSDVSDAWFFWIKASNGGAKPVTSHGHFAFYVKTRTQVDEFHAAALAAGGHDNGKPGVRAAYGPAYYAAFVLDLDKNNIEAVCREPADADVDATA